jgi:hypothetical protein
MGEKRNCTSRKLGLKTPKNQAINIMVREWLAVAAARKRGAILLGATY